MPRATSASLGREAQDAGSGRRRRERMELLAPDPPARRGWRGLHGQRDARGALVSNRQRRPGNRAPRASRCSLSASAGRHRREAGVGDREEHVLVVERESRGCRSRRRRRAARPAAAVADDRRLLGPGAELAGELDMEAPDARLAAAETAGDDVQRGEGRASSTRSSGEVVEASSARRMLASSRVRKRSSEAPPPLTLRNARALSSACRRPISATVVSAERCDRGLRNASSVKQARAAARWSGQRASSARRTRSNGLRRDRHEVEPERTAPRRGSPGRSRLRPASIAAATARCEYSSRS